MDTRVQRIYETMGLQRTRRKRQQHRIHHRTSARRRTLLVHGRVRAQDPLREPAHKTRVLTSSRNNATLPPLPYSVSRFPGIVFLEPKLSTPRHPPAFRLVEHG